MTRHKVLIGNKIIGGDLPIVIQSMTNTDTADVQKTVDQILELSDAGSEIIRLTVNNLESAKAVPKIKDKLIQFGNNTPLVGCFHYNGHQLLSEISELCTALDKYRINPGNVGFGNNKDTYFEQIIEKAILHNKPVRIGVNWGSLDQKLQQRLIDENNLSSNPKPISAILQNALIESCLQSAKQAEHIGLSADKIVISSKVSQVNELISVYRELAKKSKYALHLGLTEAGMGLKGIVSSVSALSILLSEGIGDTIRVSITPKPGQSRTEEVKICQEILQSLDLRKFAPSITSCPGCGRTTSTYFQKLSQNIQDYIDKMMPQWKLKYPNIETLRIAIMGCIVNGPGESKHADIGISLPGTGESPIAPVYIDGKKAFTLRGDNIESEFKTILSDYISKKFESR
jgi:(E)-4-hydroxy-3-methylbut-2-enyl-diphosphate synthase